MTTATNFNEAQRAMYELSVSMGLSERAAVEAATDWLANDNVPQGYSPADAVLWSQRTAGNDQLAVLEAALAECNRLLAQIEADRGHSAIADRITDRVRQSVAAFNAAQASAGNGASLREIAPRGTSGAGDVRLDETGTIVDDYEAQTDEILAQWRQSYTGPI